MSSTQILILVIVIVAVVALAVLAWTMSRRAKLRNRFGPEYDRLVEERGDRTSAEKELRGREQRHAELPIKALSAEARIRYSQAWEEVQVRFIDAPNEAVGEADRLVTDLMAERGYPTGGEFDDRVADLSVEHAHTLGHYRDAHDVSLRNERGESTTEQLRQALVHYRALFADLLGADPVPPAATSTDSVASTDSVVVTDPATGSTATETPVAAAPVATDETARR
jgi:hypothetical protein